MIMLTAANRNVGGASRGDNVHGWTECRGSAWMHVATVTGLHQARIESPRGRASYGLIYPAIKENLYELF